MIQIIYYMYEEYADTQKQNTSESSSRSTVMKQLAAAKKAQKKSFIAQLVEPHRTGIAEMMGSNHDEAS